MLQYRKLFFTIWFCSLTVGVLTMFAMGEKQSPDSLEIRGSSKSNKNCRGKIDCPACVSVGWKSNRAPYIIKQSGPLSDTTDTIYTGILTCKYIAFNSIKYLLD